MISKQNSLHGDLTSINQSENRSYAQRRRYLESKEQRAGTLQIDYPGSVCPDCNLRRVEREFQSGGDRFANCKNCWPKHGRKIG